VPALVGPFLTGVYAGDETRLGAESVFSSLTDFERAHGSIALGGLRQALRRGAPRGLPGSWSGVSGLGSLASRIAHGLPLRKTTRVENLARDGETWRIEVSGSEGSEALHADNVVLAVPAREAAELVRGVARDAAEILSTIECAPIVSLALGADPRELARPVGGFGFLVPREEKLGLLGCLFMSEIFPQRAPEGRVLLQCMLGGVRWPEAVELADDALVERVRADLDRALGLRGEPELLRIERWPRAIPQPGLDHVRRISALRKSVAQLPGLRLAGSYLDGVAVSDALTSGLRAAGEILAAQEA
jgi:oxygen-dependent protoporphyrinogen oxidase